MKSFELLVRLARCGSFSAAARQMDVSVATASKVISRLEKELGVRLFNRTTRLMSLTHQGRLVVDKATIALNHMAEAVDQLRQESMEPIGPVKVLMSSPIGKGSIIPLLREFQDKYPRVDLEICFHDGTPDLVEEGFDIAITDWVEVLDSYVSRPLCTQQIVLAASPEYLQRRGKPKTPADLAHHDCISIRMPTGHIPLWNFVPLAGKRANHRSKVKDFSFAPRARLLVLNQYDASVTAALAGLGITMAYAQGVLRHLEQGELKLLLTDYDIEPGNIESNRYYIRYPNRKYLPMAQRVFIDFLMDSFQRQEGVRFDRNTYAA